MGVTIHYHGRLAVPGRLPDLTRAIQEAVRTLDWLYVLVDERILGSAEILVHRPEAPEDEQWGFETSPVDDRWRGIIVEPPGCEPLWLTCNRSGQFIAYRSSALSYTTPGHYFAVDRLSTKTQGGGAETHFAVCGLLRIAVSHGAVLEVIDEGGFWETGDRQDLERRLALLDAAIGAMATVLDAQDQDPQASGVQVRPEIRRPLPDWRRDWGMSAGEN